MWARHLAATAPTAWNLPRVLLRGCPIVLVVGQLLVSPCQAEQTRAPIRDPAIIFQKRNNCSWLEIRRKNIVMQGADYSCGAATLATLLRYFWGDNVDEPRVLHTIDGFLTAAELKDRVQNGLSIADLRRAAVDMGYLAEVGKITFGELCQSKIPLIVAITADGYNHFVVVRGVFDQNVYLADPMRGNIRVRTSLFQTQWQKNAVLVVLKPKVQPPRLTPLTVRQKEVDLGELNNQVIRTMPAKPGSLVTP
ncbi:MAG TPA: cysteine peptidase family C39 domain-containing protein [Pirellulales bacterium]|nr:cysteine peptidase family C39 domain-containing protein [Pirellulales bacterium]